MPSYVRCFLVTVILICGMGIQASIPSLYNLSLSVLVEKMHSDLKVQDCESVDIFYKHVFPCDLYENVKNQFCMQYGFYTSGQNLCLNDGRLHGAIKAISADMRYLVVIYRPSGCQQSIRVLNLYTGELIYRLDLQHGPKYSNSIKVAEISCDNQLVAFGHFNGAVSVWDLKEDTYKRIFSGYDDTVQADENCVESIAISADNEILASGSRSGAVKIWKVQNREMKYAFTDHTEVVLTVAISPNCNFVVSGSDDGTAKLWDLSSGTLVRTLPGQADHVYSIAISGDNQIIVSGSRDGIVRVWRLDTGELMYSLAGHTGPIYSVNVSADCLFMVTCSEDRSVRIWSLITGKLMQIITDTDTYGVYLVAMSADYCCIASCDCTHGEVNFFRLSTYEQVLQDVRRSFTHHYSVQ